MDEEGILVDRLILRWAGAEDWVDVLVNGTPLRELVASVEAASDPTLAGSFGAGFPWFSVGSNEETVFDERVLQRGGTSATVLCCSCGFSGCSAIDVDVVADDRFVTWRNFQNGRRPNWDYSTLGPFAFDRAAYEAEVARMRSEYPRVLEAMRNAPPPTTPKPPRVLITPPPPPEAH